MIRSITSRPRTVVVLILILGIGGYYFYGRLNSTTGETRYVLGTVERGTIVASVSGSGQVTAENQLDLKPEVSGKVIYVGVKAGSRVGAGTLIAQIDDTDAQKTVRDARTALQSAEISLQKIQQPADTLTLTQAQNKYDTSLSTLTKAYADLYDDTTSAFLDFPSILASIKEINTGTTASRQSQWNIDFYKSTTRLWDMKADEYRDLSFSSMTDAQTSYDAAFPLYKTTDQYSATSTIIKLGNSAYETSRKTADALHNATVLIQFYEDQVKAHGQNPTVVADQALTALSTHTNSMNVHLSALRNDLATITSAEQSIVEAQQSLQKIQAGSDALDVQSAQLTVTQRRNALADAQNNLAKYYIHAPFAGTVSSIAIKKYDYAGSAAIATIVTPQRTATLSFNEVDAARIAVGQKSTLTFDAIQDLALTGKVISLDTVGTVTQGVVSYAVKIALDTQDTRIKPGMTVNASIITDVRTDTLIAPSSAVKNQGGRSTVSVFTPPLTANESTSSQGTLSATAPTAVTVTTGITDDTNVEILTGLSEGQQIVVRTVAATAAGTAATTNGATNRTGGGGFGGGAPRLF